MPLTHVFLYQTTAARSQLIAAAAAREEIDVLNKNLAVEKERIAKTAEQLEQMSEAIAAKDQAASEKLAQVATQAHRSTTHSPSTRQRSSAGQRAVREGYHRRTNGCEAQADDRGRGARDPKATSGA